VILRKKYINTKSEKRGKDCQRFATSSARSCAKNAKIEINVRLQDRGASLNVGRAKVAICE